MKDILVVGKLKEGAFEKFMGFMQSEEGVNERKKIADLTKFQIKRIWNVAHSRTVPVSVYRVAMGFQLESYTSDY